MSDQKKIEKILQMLKEATDSAIELKDSNKTWQVLFPDFVSLIEDCNQIMRHIDRLDVEVKDYYPLPKIQPKPKLKIWMKKYKSDDGPAVENFNNTCNEISNWVRSVSREIQLLDTSMKKQQNVPVKHSEETKSEETQTTKSSHSTESKPASGLIHFNKWGVNFTASHKEFNFFLTGTFLGLIIGFLIGIKAYSP